MQTLPQIQNRQGNITPVHGSVEIPFPIARLFYIYDIPGGESRGAHAHRRCEQFLVCVMGSFDVAIDDGRSRDVVRLDRSFRGLHVPPMIWASEINFSSGGIALVFASQPFDEKDYIRSYDRYLEEVSDGAPGEDPLP